MQINWIGKRWRDGRSTSEKMTDSSFGLRSMNFSFHPLDGQSQRVEWPMSPLPLPIPFHYSDTKVKMPWDQDSALAPVLSLFSSSGYNNALRLWQSWREGHNNRYFEWDEWPGLISYRGQSGHFAPTHFRHIERWLHGRIAMTLLSRSMVQNSLKTRKYSPLNWFYPLWEKSDFYCIFVNKYFKSGHKYEWVKLFQCGI